MRQVKCKSLATTPGVYSNDESDISMAKIDPGGLEIYPAVCKTISLSLEELKAVVAEIEELAD